MRDSVLANCESEFVFAAIKNKKRLDGRLFNVLRNIELHFGSDYGCAYVTLGETKVLAQVSCELSEPRNARKNEGNLFVNVEIHDMVCGVFETGHQGHLGTHTNRLIEKCIKDSRCVDLEALCIISEEQAWEIRVDVSVLNYDGNLYTCCSLAALAALAHFKTPHVTIENNEVRIESLREHEPEPLSLHHYPILVAFAIFGEGEDILLDPTELEEKVCDSELVIGMNSFRELCGMHFSGRTTGNRMLIVKAAHQASLVAIELVKLLKSKLEIDNEERKKNRGKTDGLVSAIHLDRILSASQDRNSLRVTMREIEETARSLYADKVTVSGKDSEDEEMVSDSKENESREDDVVYSKDKRSGTRLPPMEKLKYGEKWVPSGNKNSWALPNATLDDDSDASGDDVDFVKTITDEDRIIDRIELNDSDDEQDTVMVGAGEADINAIGGSVGSPVADFDVTREGAVSTFVCHSSSYSMTSPSYSSGSSLHTSSSSTSNNRKKPNYDPPHLDSLPSTSCCPQISTVKPRTNLSRPIYSPSSPSSDSTASKSPESYRFRGNVRNSYLNTQSEGSNKQSSHSLKLRAKKYKKNIQHRRKRVQVATDSLISLSTKGCKYNSGNTFQTQVRDSPLHSAAMKNCNSESQACSNEDLVPVASQCSSPTDSRVLHSYDKGDSSPEYSENTFKPLMSPVYSPSSPSPSYSPTSCPYSSPTQSIKSSNPNGIYKSDRTNRSTLSPSYSPSSPSKQSCSDMVKIPQSPVYSPSSPSLTCSPQFFPSKKPFVFSPTDRPPSLSSTSPTFSLNSPRKRPPSSPMSKLQLSPDYTPSSPSKPPPSSPSLSLGSSTNIPPHIQDERDCNITENDAFHPKGNSSSLNSPTSSQSPVYSSDSSSNKNAVLKKRVKLQRSSPTSPGSVVSELMEFKPSTSKKLKAYSRSGSPQPSSFASVPERGNESPQFSMPSPKYSPSSKMISSEASAAVVPPYSPSSPSRPPPSLSLDPSSPESPSDRFSVGCDSEGALLRQLYGSPHDSLDSLSSYSSSSFSSGLPSPSSGSPRYSPSLSESEMQPHKLTPSPPVSPAITSPRVSSSSSSPLLETSQPPLNSQDSQNEAPPAASLSVFSPSLSPELPDFSPSSPSHQPPSPDYSPSSPSYSSGSCSPSESTSSRHLPNILSSSPTSSQSSTSTEPHTVVLKVFIPKSI